MNYDKIILDLRGKENLRFSIPDICLLIKFDLYHLPGFSD